MPQQSGDAGQFDFFVSYARRDNASGLITGFVEALLDAHQRRAGRDLSCRRPLARPKSRCGIHGVVRVRGINRRMHTNQCMGHPRRAGLCHPILNLEPSIPALFLLTPGSGYDSLS